MTPRDVTFSSAALAAVVSDASGQDATPAVDAVCWAFHEAPEHAFRLADKVVDDAWKAGAIGDEENKEQYGCVRLLLESAVRNLHSGLDLTAQLLDAVFFNARLGNGRTRMKRLLSALRECGQASAVVAAVDALQADPDWLMFEAMANTLKHRKEIPHRQYVLENQFAFQVEDGWILQSELRKAVSNVQGRFMRVLSALQDDARVVPHGEKDLPQS